MKANLIITTISQLIDEIARAKGLKDKNKNKYLNDFKKLKNDYKDVSINDDFKAQYNQLNSKGMDLIKELRDSKNIAQNELNRSIEVYIRYAKASLCDFEGKTLYLRKYITSFMFSAMLFLALSPQFYGFVLPVLFFLPIYMGLKGVKNRSIAGFYMTMSVVPVAMMTSFTWIRYGINSSKNITGAVTEIVKDGVSQNLAEVLVRVGPILGTLLLIFTCLQLYRGIKTKDLFI